MKRPRKCRLGLLKRREDPQDGLDPIAKSFDVRHPLNWLAITLATYSVVYLLCVWCQSFAVGQRLFFALHDDAMISMRYAHNLAVGYGLVWNPGDRVEGMTNLGWTLWMAGIHRITVDPALAPLLVSLTNLVVNLSIIILM